MEASQEDILAAVKEVMSSKEFNFDGKDPFLDWLSMLPNGLGYILLGIILITLFLYLVYSLQGKGWKRDSIQHADQAAAEVHEECAHPLAATSIEQLHALFLQSLQGRNIVTIRKWKTNTDYIQESGNPLFEKISMFYDQAVYGTKEISPESLSQLSEQFKIWERR